MEANNLIQKSAKSKAAVFMLLLLFPFLCMMAGTKAKAAEVGTENPTYTFNSTSDVPVSTKANPGEVTVLIFGNVGCSRTRSTLSSISSCDWVGRPDIRVIFAENQFASKEKVQEYELGYGCPDIIFCYDTSDGILAATAGYTGKNGGMSPVIVLIDSDNKVQSITEGKKTAEEIIAGIKQFADIEYDGPLTPPAGSESGIANLPFVLTDINGAAVSTKANPDEVTVLMFGYTTCGKTKSTLDSIAGSEWGKEKRGDIRLIYADVYGAGADAMKEFAQNYADTSIIFCHDEEAKNWNYALTYLGLYQRQGGSFPYIIYIDKNNNVQNITLGPYTADEIMAEIEKIKEISAPDPNPGTGTDPNPDPGTNPNPGTGTDPNPGTGTDPNPGTGTDPNPGTGTDSNPDSGSGTTANPVSSISNVSGLKITSSAKKVTITWKKIPEAKGYLIYQYSSSEKNWNKKAVVKTNRASYTVTGLSPATGYRFAVKAYTQGQDGKQIVSGAYTSVYTATAPGAVDFKITPGKKKATVKWSKVKGATGYTVYYKTKAKASWKKLKTTKGKSYTKTKLKSGKTYFFTVKAYKTYKGKIYTSSFKTKKVKIK